MSDRWAYSLAAAAAAGALLAWPGPRLVALGLVVLALAVRQPLVLCLAVALLASFSAAAAEAAVRVDPEPGPFAGRIVLVSDPVKRNGATRVVVDGSAGRLEAWAWGRAGARLSGLLAGEVVQVQGRLAGLPDGRDWLRRDGVIGRLIVTAAGEATGGAAHHRIANRVRTVLDRGTASLPAEQRALFTGLVFGDDRNRSPITADDFKAAGLTHLLAVSGQNVAFVLLLAQPLLVRLGLWARWAAVLAGLGLFATVTRFEPSVLRATVMAAVAVTVWLAGREASGRRVLALTVVALLLWNPLLVHSLAFRLSVAASAGILFWGSRLAERIGGPRPLAMALAVTVAAQLAVAPLIIPIFGGLPTAALPANLLAAPAAAGVMMWGLTGGIVAGLVGGPAAALLHLPTRGMIGWIETVASVLTEMRLGELGLGHVLVVAAALAVIVIGRRRRLAVLGAWLAITVVLVLPFTEEHRPAGAPAQALAVGWESTLWRAPGSAVLLLGADESVERLLGDVRAAGVERIDLIVASSGGVRSAADVGVLRRRYGQAVVWAPVGNRIAGAFVPDAYTLAAVGELDVAVLANDRRLEVLVTGPEGER